MCDFRHTFFKRQLNNVAFSPRNTPTPSLSSVRAWWRFRQHVKGFPAGRLSCRHCCTRTYAPAQYGYGRVRSVLCFVFGQVDNLYQFAHVEHEYLISPRDGSSFFHQTERLRDRHEEARNLGVRYRHRTVVYSHKLSPKNVRKITLFGANYTGGPFKTAKRFRNDSVLFPVQ